MTGGILIADGNDARARRLAGVCASRGLHCRVCANGAAALELALAELPEVVVAPFDLPLIDARKLAEILGANPRTRDVRFLFLGREERGQPRARGLFDDALPPSADAEEIVDRIEAMAAQRARIDAVERDAMADHEVQGKLSQIPLTDLLQLFHMNRRTGTLEVSRREAGGREERGAILIRDGNLVQATAGAGVEGEKALYRLLAWRDGSFAFSPNQVNVTPRILTPTRALLMEGVRQLDEWNRMLGSLPPLGARVRLAVSRDELPNAVHPVSQEVLHLLELYEEVREIVDHCSYPDYQVLRTLQTLVERGLLEIRREPDRRVGEAHGPLFDASQLRRLRDWVESSRPRGAPLVDPKLVVLSTGPEVTRDFVRLLDGLPGIQLSPAFQRGTFAETDLAPLGRLAADEGLGIQLIHAPADERFAPLWPVVAHGALGALLLLASPIAEAEQQLEPAIAVLRDLPRARLFHLLLLRKGERVSAEDLQDKLSLLDTASLFLLPLEGAKDPVSLLRVMLGRVMP